jgi:bifunctional non-homologous end joining protein LigD
VALPDGDTLDVTNLDKVFWPRGRRTKGDLLRYYAQIAPLLLPVIADRPLVMKRLPNGVDDKAFYQHRAPEPVPAGVRTETLPDDDVPARLVGGSLKTLLYMAQLASISMDPFFSTIDALDTPDQVAIDLDPQPGATFQHILDVARWVHETGAVEAFQDLGFEGLHLHPLRAGTPYQAGMLSARSWPRWWRPPIRRSPPSRHRGKRRPGTIYVDYLQNIEARPSPAPTAPARARLPACRRRSRGPSARRRASGDVHARHDPAARRRGRRLWAGTRQHEGADLLGALEKLR